MVPTPADPSLCSSTSPAQPQVAFFGHRLCNTPIQHALHLSNSSPNPSLTLTPCMQDAESNWQFDIFAYAEATPGTSLSMLTFHLLKTTGLVKDFNLIETKLVTCLRRVEAGYDPVNPYHNRSPCYSSQHIHASLHGRVLMKPGSHLLICSCVHLSASHSVGRSVGQSGSAFVLTYGLLARVLV